MRPSRNGASLTVGAPLLTMLAFRHWTHLRLSNVNQLVRSGATLRLSGSEDATATKGHSATLSGRMECPPEEKLARRRCHAWGVPGVRLPSTRAVSAPVKPATFAGTWSK